VVAWWANEHIRNYSVLLENPLTKELQEFYCCWFTTAVVVLFQNQGIKNSKKHMTNWRHTQDTYITANFKGFFVKQTMSW